MDKYDLEYKGVRCYGVQWEADPPLFAFTYEGRDHIFEQTRYISQTADTDHIRCAIDQFLEVMEKEREMKKYTWSRHSDDEIWQGGVYDSVKECVEEARNEGYKSTDSFALGYVEPYQVNYVNSYMIIEYLQDNAYDEIGEVSDGWLSGITKEQEEDLESRVVKVVLEWLKDCKEEPTFYKVLPFDELTLQEALQKYDRSTTKARVGNER